MIINPTCNHSGLRQKPPDSLWHFSETRTAVCSREGLPDYVWDHYQESVPMSTYLVAFVVSDFASMSTNEEQQGNGTRFKVWARKAALAQAHYSLEIGPRILEYFEEYFGIKYPLPKIDMIALPDFQAGAMENWGLITYRSVYPHW